MSRRPRKNRRKAQAQTPPAGYRAQSKFEEGPGCARQARQPGRLGSFKHVPIRCSSLGLVSGLLHF